MRRYVLVSYDIANRNRLQKVYKIMRGYGDGFQDSVFLCQISDKEEAIMIMKLKELIKEAEDQIVIIHLGNINKDNISNPREWKILGKKFEVKDNSIIIF